MNKKLATILIILFSLGCVNNKKDSAGQDSLSRFQEEYRQLSKEYQEKLKNNPENRELAIDLAEFYYDFRDYEAAENTIKNIKTRKARVLLAKVLVRAKEYDRAMEIYQTIIDDLEDQEALFLYGRVLEKKNLFPQAIGLYFKVKEPFEKQAKARIKFIEKKIETVFPQKVKELSKKAEGFLSRIKDEAVIALSFDESIEILPNRASVSTIHAVKQILKERGKNSAEIKIGYDSTYEKVEFEYARTITGKGKVIYAGKENIRDVSRYLDYPLYSNSRAFIISMPAVGVGSYLEYKVKIHSSKLVAKDNFNFIYRVREKYPIFRADFKLITPGEKKAYFKFFNKALTEEEKLEPVIRSEGEKRIYSWEFNQLKPIIPEYNMPPLSRVNPAILVSSFSNWQDIYDWWFSLYRDKLKLTSELKEFLQNLVNSAKNKREKAKTIYEYVAKNIRYVAVEYGDSGYEPHSAGEVFINKYGDCKDQAILLVALMKEAGLDAYPVLIPTRSNYPIDKDFPSISFNHAIAAVRIDDEFIFMDPTSDTTGFGDIPLSDQGRNVLLFLEKDYKIIETPVSKGNGIAYSMDIDIGQDQKTRIRREVLPSGYFAYAYRSYLKYSHPSRIKENIYQKMIEISPFSRLLDYEIKYEEDLDKRPRLAYAFLTDDFLKPAGAFRVLGDLDQIGLEDSIISKDERNFPIDFRGIFSKEARITINLPAGLKVKYLPDSQFFDNRWFSLKIDYKSMGQAIKFDQKFSIKKRFVEKEDYQAFKENFKKALYYLKSQIILEKVNN